MGTRTSKRTRYPGIYEVAGGQRIRYMVSYRIRGLGQRTRTFPSLKEAKQFQGSVRDPLRQRQLRELEQGRVTLGIYFPQWLGRRRNLTPATRLRYEGIGRNYISPSRLSRLPVSGITRDDVEDWLTELIETGVPTPTVDKTYRTLRACLTTAVLEGKAWANPASQIEIPRLEDREPFFLTAGQVDAVAAEVDPRHRALVYFLAYTGARMGEATALRVRNLDLVRGVVRIIESSPEVGGRKLQAASTKTKMTRAISLSEPLVGELAAHLEQFGSRSAYGSIDPEGYAFTSGRGGQVRQNNWRTRVFQPACRRAGVTRRRRDGRTEVPRVHDLRHTAASLAASAGFSLHEVKELLGHSTIKTTSDRYLHLFEDNKREKAARLGELMISARPAATVVSLATKKERPAV